MRRAPTKSSEGKPQSTVELEPAFPHDECAYSSRVGRIEEKVWALWHNRGRDTQNRRPLLVDPSIAKTLWDGWCAHNILHRQVVDVDCHQHIIVRQQFRRQIKVYADLEDGERSRGRCINERAARGIPTPAIEAGALSAEIGKRFATESPSQHLRRCPADQAAIP
jgi:hypothetical protein